MVQNGCRGSTFMFTFQAAGRMKGRKAKGLAPLRDFL